MTNPVLISRLDVLNRKRLTRRKSMDAFSVTSSKVTGHILSHLINIVATWEAVLQMDLIPFKLCCTLYIKL